MEIAYYLRHTLPLAIRLRLENRFRYELPANLIVKVTLDEWRVREGTVRMTVLCIVDGGSNVQTESVATGQALADVVASETFIGMVGDALMVMDAETEILVKPILGTLPRTRHDVIVADVLTIFDTYDLPGDVGMVDNLVGAALEDDQLRKDVDEEEVA